MVRRETMPSPIVDPDHAVVVSVRSTKRFFQVGGSEIELHNNRQRFGEYYSTFPPKEKPSEFYSLSYSARFVNFQADC